MDNGDWAILVLVFVIIVMVIVSAVVVTTMYDEGLTRGQCDGLGFDKRITSDGFKLCCNTGERAQLSCESIDYLLKTRGIDD